MVLELSQCIGELKRGGGRDTTLAYRSYVTPNAEKELYELRSTRTVTLHDNEELDDDLRGRTDEDLALATALSVHDVVLQYALRLGDDTEG